MKHIESTPPDWRGLCEELVNIATAHANPDAEAVGYVAATLTRARAALAQPEPAEPDGPAVQSREPASVVGEPSDEEIIWLMPQQMHDDLAAAVRAMAEQEGIDSIPAKGVMRIMLNRHVVDLARAVLARYAHQPAPPGAGEVAELARLLRLDAHLERGDGMPQAAARFDRAADLLEQRHPAPVPVAERLPGPGDCDAEGRCWLYSGDWMFKQFRFRGAYDSYWLPAHALPLPQEEVE